MALVKVLFLIVFLFLITVFIVPELEAAVGTIGAEEALKPFFSFLPIGFVGCVFMAIIYLARRD